MNDRIKQHYDSLVKHSDQFLLAVVITVALCLVFVKYYMPTDKGTIEDNNPAVSSAVPSPEMSPETSEVSPEITEVKNVKERVAFGDMVAIVGEQNGQNSVILSRDGVNTILAQAEGFGEADSAGGAMAQADFDSLEFSLSGNYLSYRSYGYAYSIINIYDIKNKKEIPHGFYSSASDGFIENEKYFYDCISYPFTGELAARVFELPDFKIKYDMPSEEEELVYGLELACEYDADKKVVRFIFSNSEEETETKKIVEYSLITDKAEVK